MYSVVPIRLINPSSESITIYKGTKIAEMFPVSQDQGSHRTGSELPPEAKKVLWKMEWSLMATSSRSYTSFCKGLLTYHLMVSNHKEGFI